MALALSTEARTALAHLAKADKLVSQVNEITERLEKKAEQHYMAAALIFKKIKTEHNTSADGPWKKVCLKKCGLSWQRVYELIELAGGQRTLADQRKQSARSSAKSRAKKGLSHDQSDRPSPLPGFTVADEDPRVNYRMRLVNLLMEAENIAQELLNPKIVVFDCAGLVTDAEQVAASWKEVVLRYRGLAKHERQKTLPKKSAA